MKTKETLTNDEVVVADTQFKDVILIQTLNSLYKFAVVEASKRYGRLRGGAFRESSVEVCLCVPSLKVGTSARLFVRSGQTCKFLKTSIIKRLTLIRNAA